ncbi:unnamed protein product [Phyllotreta striolata]|uniref:ER membrane protein complex subunit 7 beta-sandwich domain-containing protein n=1 Tax=Phyllotreta striolata TaxID=444603 RepID=A0A9N9U129_PHYSR|nr:unnamed protein product [Phyllotreta striolata]
MNLITIPLVFLLCFVNRNICNAEGNVDEENDGTARYTLEGRVFPLSDTQQKQPHWQAHTRIHVNGGEYLGFVKKDGSFVIHNVPSGSYVVEALHPEFSFEPARVEINSKGKFRARRVNHLKTSDVTVVPYPLRMKALGKTRYFQVREQWRITDLLFNPMVMMMVLPLLLIMVLPKMMNDPETKKEMEQLQSMTKFEMSDVVSNFLAGSATSQSPPDRGQAANKKNLKSRKRIEK